MERSFDVVIVGGSFAGLSAAMSLARAMKTVMILDRGTPCNRFTPHSHNFITHDGKAPADIAEEARKDVRKYPTVYMERGEVDSISKEDEGFMVRFSAEGASAKEQFRAKKILLATGLEDILPPIEGFSDCWGKTILHCPYCHGYEYKNCTTAILGHDKRAFEQAKLIVNWAKGPFILSNGETQFTAEQQAVLGELGVKIHTGKIKRFVHKEGVLEKVVFEDGSVLILQVIYANPDFKQQSDLADRLGCKFTDRGYIEVDLFQKTSVRGVYAAGDNSTRGRSIAMAAAFGSLAGIMMSKELISQYQLP